MAIRKIKVKGIRFNIIKFQKLSGKELKMRETLAVVSDAELERIYNELHERFGRKRLLADPLYEINQNIKPEIETVPLFGFVGEQIEV